MLQEKVFLRSHYLVAYPLGLLEIHLQESVSAKTQKFGENHSEITKPFRTLNAQSKHFEEQSLQLFIYQILNKQPKEQADIPKSFKSVS